MGIISYMRTEAKVIRERDPAIKSNLEVILYPGFKAVLYYRLAHKLYLRKHFFLARWISQRTARRTGIEIHPGAVIGKGLFIDHGNGVVIGTGAKILGSFTVGEGARIGAGTVVLKEVPAGATAVGTQGHSGIVLRPWPEECR